MSYNTSTYLLMCIIILNKLHVRSDAGFNYILNGIYKKTQKQYRDSALREYNISELIVSTEVYNVHNTQKKKQI